jgi:putative flippase GtrA
MSEAVEPNWLVRWLKFNLAGAGGMLVQLGLLEAWMHFSLGNYLLGTAVAVEAALVHNFGWHSVFTWRERSAGSRRVVVARAIRFHLLNGVVSIVGNLAIIQLMAGGLRSPVLVANVVAIMVCSAVNFLLGDRWVFDSG